MLRHMGRGAMNRALRMLFGSGYRMRSAKGKQVGHLMFSFLGHYAMCANITMGRRNEALPWPLNTTWLHMMPMIFWINLPNLTRWRIPSFEQIKSKKIFLAVQVDYRVVFYAQFAQFSHVEGSHCLRRVFESSNAWLKRYGYLSKLIGTIGVFRPLQLTVLKATHTITGLYVKSWLAVFVLGPVVVQSGASTQSGDARKRSREKSGSRSGHIWGGSGATLKTCGIMDRSS